MAIDDDTRTAWLEWRRGGIGASEIAAVCGRSPWASPLSVYLRKRGEIPDDGPPTEAMRLGLALEDLVADEFHLQTGLYVAGRQAWCQHPDFEWARATVDGFAVEAFDGERADALGVFESKTTGDLSRFDPLPDYVALQVQWQMFVTGETNAWLAVLGGGYRLSVLVVEVARDDAAIEAMVTAGAEFWRRVESGEPPTVETYFPGDAADLAAAFPEPEPGSVVDLDDDGAQLVEDLRTYRAAAKRLDNDVTRAENAVKALLGDNEAGAWDGKTVVTWRPVESSRVDTKRLRSEEPDLAERFLTTSTTRRLLVK